MERSQDPPTRPRGSDPIATPLIDRASNTTSPSIMKRAMLHTCTEDPGGVGEGIAPVQRHRRRDARAGKRGGGDAQRHGAGRHSEDEQQR